MYDSISNIWFGILGKDPACWSQLVHRLSPLVYTVANKSGLQPTEAEDCAQQTWTALYQSRHKIKDPNRIPVWLIRVASREATRIIKSRSRHQSEQPELPEHSEGLPDRELELLESAAILKQGMELLGDRCHKLLDAIFLAPEKKKYADIARDLGIPANSLGPTRTRCLNKLRKILEELGYW